MISVFTRCSAASLVIVGFVVEAPDALSVAALTHAAVPGSGTSLVALCKMAQMKTLCACSVAGVASRK